ncbi:hypothetical protein KAJ27_15480, partial [bacterium]|nr:hypothetical protein [bacterium]
MLKIISFIIMFGFGLFAQDTSQTSKSIDIVPLDLEEIPDAQDEGNFISLEKHNEVLESLMDSLKLIKTDKSDIKILEKELLSLKDSLTILQSITQPSKSVKIDTIYS